MEGEWPLIGRTAVLDRVDGLLRRGAGGVVLAGPAGVAKTRLAIGGTAAGSTLPFGAFALLFPDEDTVQNKLHTAYEKPGVDGRAELAEALQVDR